LERELERKLDEDRLREFRVASYLSAFASAVGPRPWREATWDGFVETPQNSSMVHAIREYSGKGLVLSGPSGTGKTRLALILAKQLIEKLCARALFINASEFLRTVRTAIPSQQLEVMESAKKVPILVLDDLHPLHERERTDMLELVDYRYRNEKILIVTTNVAAKDFDAAFGMQIASRLIDKQYSSVASYHVGAK
jgi:DNA replication protein DnaC